MYELNLCNESLATTWEKVTYDFNVLSKDHRLHIIQHVKILLPILLLKIKSKLPDFLSE
jgi:hypothetical protein